MTLEWRPATSDVSGGIARLMSGPQRTSETRHGYVDAAKGISIFLVVYWHYLEDSVAINEALVFLRMPLFFFVAGIFAKNSLYLPLKSFARDKVGSILYLFALWTFITYLSTDFIGQFVGTKREINIFKPFLLFIDPPDTLWFMYALAVSYVATKLIVRIPWPIALLGLFTLYTISVSSGEWRDIPFIERILRLLPFFFIATLFSERVRKVATEFAWTGLPLLAIFLFCALQVYHNDLAKWAPVTFCLGLLGILSILMTCFAMRSFLLVRLFEIIGKRSIFIYVMHKIPLYYFERISKLYGVEANPIVMSALAVAMTACCYLFGEYLLNKHAGWLFTAPWLLNKQAEATKSVAA